MRNNYLCLHQHLSVLGIHCIHPDIFNIFRDTTQCFHWNIFIQQRTLYHTEVSLIYLHIPMNIILHTALIDIFSNMALIDISWLKICLLPLHWNNIEANGDYLPHYTIVIIAILNHLYLNSQEWMDDNHGRCCMI